MRLEDKHLVYDESIPPAEQLRRIKFVMENSASGVELLMAGMGIPELVHRCCWMFGVSPLWVLVSLQRERSILGRLASSTDLDYACGVTGQDGPGMANPLWKGLGTQVYMSARTIAWLAGIGKPEAFGYRPGLWPSEKRWEPVDAIHGKPVNLLDTPPSIHTARSRAEYAQLAFTPHIKVLDTNGEILAEQVLPLWNAPAPGGKKP